MLNDIVNETRFKKISSCLLWLTIFLSYWLFSRQYTGPAYLSDEVAYLTKAAAFAGYPVDMASSWYGGYSLILSPVFMIFSDPLTVWQGIMILNAAIWTFSFMLLSILLKDFFPENGFWTIYFAVVICALYPAWITMSGYAFSTTGFVFVFMLSIFALLKSSVGNIWSIIPYSILVGFLCWIHPTGFAVAVASVLVIFALSRYYHFYSILAVHVIVMVGVVAIYKVGVHEWLNRIMTTGNFSNKIQYPSLSTVALAFLQVKFWSSWIIISFGHVSYLFVSTLGLCFFALVDISARIFRLIKVEGEGKSDVSALVNISLVYMVLSILGVVLLGALFFSTYGLTKYIRLDQWVFGRYSEAVLLPLLGVGVLAVWRIKHAIWASLFVLISAGLIYCYSNAANTKNSTSLINIPSLWSQALFPDRNSLIWLVVGVAGILLASILKKRFFIFLVIPIFVFSIRNQNIWHNNILQKHSKPSSLVELITSNFKLGECIGVDAFLPQGSSLFYKERRNLYSFYFFNYNIRRMSPSEWLSSCDGPFLTYRADIFSDSLDVKIIAREVSSGLFLVIKKERMSGFDTKTLPANLVGISVNLEISNTCWFKGCFSKRAADLRKFSKTGLHQKGEIVTNNKSGYLFYGPYSPLKKADYYIKLDGTFINLEGASLDIVSRNGTIKHLNVVLSDVFDSEGDTILIPFSLSSDVNHIEVRLRVSSKTELSIYGYSITLNNKGGGSVKASRDSFIN